MRSNVHYMFTSLQAPSLRPMIRNDNRDDNRSEALDASAYKLPFATVRRIYSEEPESSQEAKP